MNFSIYEIIFGILGSGGFIAALVAAFNAITARLDARKKRLQDGRSADLTEAVEIRRDAQTAKENETSVLITNLWKIIEELKKDISALNTEIKGLHEKATFSRPIVKKVYANLLAIRREVESLNMGGLSEEQAAVSMSHLQKVRELLEHTEDILP